MSGIRKPPANIPNLALDKLSFAELFALKIELDREMASRPAEQKQFVQGATLTPTQSPRSSQHRALLTSPPSLRSSQQRPLLTSSQSMQSSRMFAVPHNTPRKTAAALLESVNDADYDTIEKTWRDNPSVMFVEVDVNGHRTTPLKRAFYNLDTHTWKPFYEWIRENEPTMLAEFYKQRAEQTEHIDVKHLQPLTDLYVAYRHAINKRGHGHINDADLDIYWDNILQLQRKLLPMSMIREMCREGVDTWNTTSKFAHKTPPKTTLIHDPSTKTNFEISSQDFKDFFGTRLGLSRGDEYQTSHAILTPGILRKGHPAHTKDGHIIAHLCKVRAAEIAKLPLLESKAERSVTFNPMPIIIGQQRHRTPRGVRPKRR